MDLLYLNLSIHQWWTIETGRGSHGIPVDQTRLRGMVGSNSTLSASRPYLVIRLCACVLVSGDRLLLSSKKKRSTAISTTERIALQCLVGEPSSAQSTSGDVSLAEPNQVNQPPDHLRKWTKDHPLDNIVGNPSRPVSTRKQLASDALW
ncbi:hypothetical protein Tco_0496484 [Tanacetum coccineum]